MSELEKSEPVRIAARMARRYARQGLAIAARAEARLAVSRAIRNGLIAPMAQEGRIPSRPVSLAAIAAHYRALVASRKARRACARGAVYYAREKAREAAHNGALALALAQGLQVGR